MILLSIGGFVGRFHPLLVHLPIGFLLLAVIFSFMGLHHKFGVLKYAVPFALFIGSVSAVMACITGYVLSFSGDYNADTLSFHMYTGIATALLSVFLWLVSIKKVNIVFFQTDKVFGFSLLLMLVLISAAGHLGGSLTHGDGYLVAGLDGGASKEKKVFTKIDDAMVFDDVVAPILEIKCSKCHNSSKMKGKLSMESFAALMKGGKHGVVIKPGNVPGSELMKRVLLSPDDEKFMPTDGKPALTKEELAVIKWWIEKAGADDKKTMAQASPPEEIKHSVSAMLGITGKDGAETAAVDEDTTKMVNGYYATLKLPPVANGAIDQLTKAGWVVRQLNSNPDLFDVVYPPGKYDGQKTTLNSLLSLKENIVWLNIADNKIGDAQLDVVAQLKNLQRLRIEKNPVTDVGVQKLSALSHIESINLYDTKITDKSVPILSQMKSLKTVYVWGGETTLTKDTLLLQNERSVQFIAGAK